jgi:hypothetical protein
MFIKNFTGKMVFFGVWIFICSVHKNAIGTQLLSALKRIGTIGGYKTIDYSDHLENFTFLDSMVTLSKKKKTFLYGILNYYSASLRKRKFQKRRMPE